ncbi:MAG TPA: MFS transporter [Caulobacteraceae bacterium]|nr:MFS transporter [Caulobacteraceae bacterium]
MNDVHSPIAAPNGLAPARLRLVMALVTGALFMEILDGTIVTTALPSMARAFGGSVLGMNVGVSAYLFALGVFIPVSGWIADRFGARKIFTSALLAFTLASALCGLTRTLTDFVVLRAIQGGAGAMMVPVGRLIVMRFTPKDRLMAALTSLTWPALIAPVLGPPLGGFITEHLGWRWIFYLNAPLGVCALVAALALVPDAYGETRRPFDWPGFVLCGVGTLTILIALETAEARANVSALAYFVGGLAVLAVAVRHLWRAKAPLMSLAAYAIPTFRASLRGGSCVRMAIGAAPFLLPLMFQAGFGFDPFHAGLLLLSLFAGNLGMKTVTTPILRRFGYRPVLIANGVLSAASLAACALIDRGTPLLATVAILFAGGMTRSLQFTTLSTLAFADVPRPHLSDANGLFATVNQIGGAAGIALAALAVRGAGVASRTAGVTDASVPYRLAFLILALVALVGVADTAKLPAGAGNAFVKG